MANLMASAMANLMASAMANRMASAIANGWHIVRTLTWHTSPKGLTQVGRQSYVGLWLFVFGCVAKNPQVSQRARGKFHALVGDAGMAEWVRERQEARQRINARRRRRST